VLVRAWWKREPLWKRAGDSSSQRAEAALDPQTPTEVRAELLEDAAVLRRLAGRDDVADLGADVLEALVRCTDVVTLLALSTSPSAPLEVLERLPAFLIGADVLEKWLSGPELEAVVALQAQWSGTLGELREAAEALDA
jgi:hypothetical protein